MDIMVLFVMKKVIVNPDKHQVCCFSPPKSVSMDHFLRDTRNVCTNTIPDDVVVNEIIEGLNCS